MGNNMLIFLQFKFIMNEIIIGISHKEKQKQPILLLFRH